MCERERERVGDKEGFRSLLRKRAKQRSMDESLMHAAAAINTYLLNNFATWFKTLIRLHIVGCRYSLFFIFYFFGVRQFYSTLQ